MNGLVGYGSSDDEEREAEDDVLPTTIKVGSSSEATRPYDGIMSENFHDSSLKPQREVNNDTEDSTLMVGPQMPTSSGVISEIYDEDDLAELPHMSERDLLRYLTQPTHPIETLPPEPTTPADSSVTMKLRRFIDLKSKGIHFNEDLVGKASFRNPNLFASLLERTGLSPEAQYISALPPGVLSMNTLPAWAYKEALHETQKSLIADHKSTRKAQSTTGKRTIDFTPASQESTPGTQKRKKT